MNVSLSYGPQMQTMDTFTRGATWSLIFFRIFEIIIFCFVVAICDLVHAMEAMYGLPQVITTSGNLF